LRSAALLHEISGNLLLTRTGRTTLQRHVAEEGRQLGLALIRAGQFSEQARRLIERGSIDGEGVLRCPALEARDVASSLLGVLRRWSDVEWGAEIVVPKHLVEEIAAAWSVTPPVDEIAAKKNEVGFRAELYSYQLERLTADDASLIAWVSRDDQGLGYDLEDRTPAAPRVIEVKGSGGNAVRFYLSANEYRRAEQYAEKYEVQFWGGIDLQRPPQSEFQALRGMGYPRLFHNVAELIANGSLIALPEVWRVTELA
jgi:hypothetical protein